MTIQSLSATWTTHAVWSGGKCSWSLPMPETHLVQHIILGKPWRPGERQMFVHIWCRLLTIRWQYVIVTKPLRWKKGQWSWARAMCPWSSGNNAGCDWPQLLQRKLTSSQHKGDGRVAFVLVKQLSTVEWTNWGCQWFSLRSLKDCDCLPDLGDQHGGSESVAQPNV